MKRNQNEDIIPEMSLNHIPNNDNGVKIQKFSESDSLVLNNLFDIDPRVHFKVLREDIFQYLYEQEYRINDLVIKAG